MTTYNSFFKHQNDVGHTRQHFIRSRPETTRSDVVIEEEIWNAILKDRSLMPHYQENIEVNVEDGRVKLTGHVQKQGHIPLIVDIAHRVKGVVWVKSELVADNLLQDQVIKALLQDETTSPYIFMVKSSFGWIHLSGLVPSQEIARAAEAVTGFVPGVRGILTLPSVFGAAWLSDETEPEPPRRALQPRLAARVYQECEAPKQAEAGWVSQVIIDPCSRLVNAIAVAVPGQSGKDRTVTERLVPMSAVEAANAEQVWLKEGEKVENHPLYDRSQFLTPPPNWRPPFPYRPGMVRWSV